MSKTPWMDEAEKQKGKGEKNKTFVAYMSGFWKKLGLGFKTIIGSTYAWCGLFVCSMLVNVGLTYQKDGAAAKNWDKFGQKIEWKTQGIPRGAIVRINHNSDCKSASGNHVGFSNGDCTVEDLKSGNFNMLGGNQSDQVKVSAFPVADICSVSFPPGVALPPKVVKSNGCKAAYASEESTR